MLHQLAVGVVLLGVFRLGDRQFRIDFTNGGHVEGEGFLLDLPAPAVRPERAAEMLVSSMNLLRTGPVTLRRLEVVRHGEHDDAPGAG